MLYACRDIETHPKYWLECARPKRSRSKRSEDFRTSWL